MAAQVLRGYEKESRSQVLMTGEVLPDQFYTSPYTAYAKRPTALLMQAVLEDAFVCYQSQFITTSSRSLRLAREAEDWFSSNATDWPFTFVNICLALGLEPTYVRQGLQRWHTRPPQEIRRKKRRVVMARRIEGLAA